jgi:vacuolar protein-sorting-associated protein 4
MQGVGNDMDGILVLGATNVPWELDSAIRRRFQKRIYIQLPDANARSGIFRTKVGKTKHSLVEDDFIKLGELSEGYSGSDCSIVVNEALMMPVRKCQSGKFFKQTPDGGWTPTFPSDPAAKPMTLMDINPPSLLRCPDVCMNDFMEALQRIKPSTNEKDINDHIKWTSEFGQDG